MGIRNLITFLQPYASLESLAGQEIIIDGPALAHYIYHICLRATPGTRNAFEAAPSYSVLIRTALKWLARLERAECVIKKIYFDGFLPGTKYGVRVERLIGYTQQLGKFHQEKPTPCRASYPRFENELDDPFDSSAHSNHTALPSLPFLVPAILEALITSAEYGPATEVVPGEADLWCAEYARRHGGLVLTGDSDLLVHDLGRDGAVSFLKDIQHSPDEAIEGLTTNYYRPATIAKRLQLPESYGLQSVAFEMVKDPFITHRKLLKQAQSSEAITKHPEDFANFLKEYAQSLPKLSDKLEDKAGVNTVLKRLDPRISEYVLQCPSFALRDTMRLPGGGGNSEAHVFLPFLLDCPVNTSAWENSISIRQLAYSMTNLISSDTEQVQSVFEHRKQVDNSRGREIQLIDAPRIPDACSTLLLTLLGLKNKLPGLTASQLWTAWSVDQDDSSLTTVFMQQFLQIESSEGRSSFTWETIRFFAELQASYYSFRILKQILDVIIALNHLGSLPSSVQSLHAQLQYLPDLTQFPSLFDASCAVRKIGNQEPMVAIKGIIQTLRPTNMGTRTELSAIDAEKSEEQSKQKKKRKRSTKLADHFATKKGPANMFELLSTE